MIIITKHPGSLSFAGNPIIYEAEVSYSQIEVSVEIGGEMKHLSLTPYKSADYEYFPSKIRVDISDIVQALIDKHEIEIEHGQMIHPVGNFSYRCVILFSDKQTVGRFELTVFRGGISNNIRNSLSNYDLDMFTYRLNNYQRNFLFTTRTNSHHLSIRETESYPFIFIHPGQSISFVTNTGRIITQSALDEGIVCSMDFAGIRQMFAELYKELPSYIVVQVNREYSFDITFTQNQISEERFNLLFKNSLGAYESIEVVGSGYLNPKFEDENLYQSLSANDTFESYRDRLVRKDQIEVETGYKTKNELLFIQDMIASDEIYLTEGTDLRRCYVNVDEIRIARKQVSPYSIPLTIGFVYNEQYYTPPLDFSYPDNVPLVNITRSGHPEINGSGIIYGDDNFLYAE